MADVDEMFSGDDEKMYDGHEQTEESMGDHGDIVYAGTKDGENYGFYLPDTVTNADGSVSLTDFVILTGAEHMELLDGQSAGKVIVFHKGAKPTLEAPPPPSDDELAAQIRSKRDALIDGVEWRIQRYQQQSALGIETTDSAETYTAILAYAQELRDITKQDGFPKEVVFPELAV